MQCGGEERKKMKGGMFKMFKGRQKMFFNKLDKVFQISLQFPTFSFC